METAISIFLDRKNFFRLSSSKCISPTLIIKFKEIDFALQSNAIGGIRTNRPLRFPGALNLAPNSFFSRGDPAPLFLFVVMLEYP